MKRALVLAAALAALPATARAAPDGEIRAAFDRYRTAILRGDGIHAAAELDDNSVRYYDQLRSAALSAPDIHGLPLLDKLLVVRIRHELPPDLLSSMDGRALLAYVIGKRWIDAAQVARGSLGKIAVRGARADAQVAVGGKPLPAALAFRREKTGWRLDLTAQNEASGRALEALRTRAKLSSDELVTKMVEEASGRPVPVAVWRPMAPAR